MDWNLQKCVTFDYFIADWNKKKNMKNKKNLFKN